MKPRQITSGVYLMGADDWDRRLFDALIPLPDGTSYNAYLIEGSEKTVLIDTADPTKKDELMAQLEGVKKLDYVISLHAEQDHSGLLPAVLAKYPQAGCLCSVKAKKLLMCHLGIADERITTVEDGEALSLGDKNLTFIYIPWVHWPETMAAYLHEDRILFPCDLFGSHLATSVLTVADEVEWYEPAKRYYAEIMAPFRALVMKHLDKLAAYPIEMIAPSHGPIYSKPKLIMEAYRHWAGDPPKNLVMMPYVTMHGSTLLMVDYLTSALVERGVHVARFDLTCSDPGKLAMALVDAATLVVGTPTIHHGVHPLVANAAYLAAFLKPKVKFASAIGSYGWGGRAVEELCGIIAGIKAELLPTVICEGLPQAADYRALDALAETIAQKHKELGLV